MVVKNLGESLHWGSSARCSSVGRWDSISRIWVSEASSTEQAERSSFNSFHEDRNINRINSGIHGTFMFSPTTSFKSFNAGKESRDMSGMNTSLLDSNSPAQIDKVVNTRKGDNIVVQPVYIAIPAILELDIAIRNRSRR